MSFTPEEAREEFAHLKQYASEYVGPTPDGYFVGLGNTAEMSEEDLLIVKGWIVWNDKREEEQAAKDAAFFRDVERARAERRSNWWKPWRKEFWT